MPVENGVNWRPVDPQMRGRYSTVGDALGAAFKVLDPDRDEFFESLADDWRSLFPGLPATPGRLEDGILFLYTRSSTVRWSVRPRLKAVAEALNRRPGAPKGLRVCVEVHG